MATTMSAEPTSVLSVIIPLRNRGGTRLDNCVRSLRWQDTLESVDIIFSDFGSDARHAAELAELADRNDARVVRHETTEIWNRSKALNIGIRAARGAYILCTDADMIFAPNFLSTLLRAQRQHRDAALCVCRCRDLPQSIPDKLWERDDFPQLLAASAYRERLGTGACQMAPRGFFHAIRGFDESYKFWGCEDKDMTFRAQRQGLALAWVHEQTAMMHQWHPSDRRKKPGRKFLNDARFHVTKYLRIKNPGGWGGAS